MQRIQEIEDKLRALKEQKEAIKRRMKALKATRKEIERRIYEDEFYERCFKKARPEPASPPESPPSPDLASI